MTDEERMRQALETAPTWLENETYGALSDFPAAGPETAEAKNRAGRGCYPRRGVGMPARYAESPRLAKLPASWRSLARWRAE